MKPDNLNAPFDIGAPPTRRAVARWSNLKLVLAVCILVQTASVLPGSWFNYFKSPSTAPVAKVAGGDPADEWKDDVWPWRPHMPWDISTSYEYPRSLEFDVEEGTWMRVDVHPRSGEIVFDLLGDIYCLPSSATYSPSTTQWTANPILLGVPHDVEPRFSSDGSKLIYISDAETGVQNVWMREWKGCEEMSLRGEIRDDDVRRALEDPQPDRRQRLIKEGRLQAQRLTNETYRWISEARFHPSGQRLVVTKRYFSSRSLPAGEGWEIPLVTSNSDAKIPVGVGRRVTSRVLPAGWSASSYGQVQIGPEQNIWLSEDTVAYSLNVRDYEGAFEYSKDVHKGIYAIMTKNLTNNETNVLVDSSPGGASRPELSRDGKTLAFVRRVREKEVLVLKDLQSGTIHHVWDGLTYDLSTISAPMGTYPSFAFSPKDDAIILWAAGKIWRVPLSQDRFGEKVRGGPPQVINFKAHVEKKLAKTAKSKVDLLKLESSDEQVLQAFTELNVDELGQKVVFQAAGISYFYDIARGDHLGFTSLDSVPVVGSPKKVPVLHSHLSYYTPSFVPSSNGSLVIHARWSNTNFSSFEIANLVTGSTYDVTGLPFGRFISPVLCECPGKDRMIAFVKAGGDILTGDVVATAGEGLYIGSTSLPDGDLSGSGTVEIRGIKYIPSPISASSPVFLRFFNGAKSLLVQQGGAAFVINVAGGPGPDGSYSVETVASGPKAQEMTVSLSGTGSPETIAFAELYNVHLVKANKVGTDPVSSKPGKAPASLARASLDGGHDLQWSRDGKKLFWLLGPYLHSLEVEKLEKCQREIQEDRLTFGIDCVKNILEVQKVVVKFNTDVARLKEDLQLKSSLEGGDTLFVINARILTMQTGNLEQDLVDDGILVIREGVVEGIVMMQDFSAPLGATIIDAEGAFIIPGFIDAHAHWSGFGNLIPATSWELQTFLAYGVTTMHNPSSDNVRGFVERGRVENGGMVGPRIYHTGNVIYGAEVAQYHQEIATMEEARSALIRIKAEGGDASFSYKNYNQYSRAARQRLLIAAEKIGFSCYPEGGMNFDWDLTYIIDGMTTIEHNIPIPELYDDVLTLYALSGTGATPTHIVNYGGGWGEQLVWAFEDVPHDPKLRKLSKHDDLDVLAESIIRPIHSYSLFNTSTSVAKMVKKGLRAHIGAHGEPPIGLNYHAEMQFAKAGGLSNFEVLRAATIDAAITLGIDNAVGSLSPGKLADFLIYEPSADLLGGHIKSTRKIRFVARGGRVWDASNMVEHWPVKGRESHLPPINAD